MSTTSPSPVSAALLEPRLQGGQTPYGGTAWTVPGTSQVEDFDNGGEGVAYHDLTTENEGGEYRTEEGVDIESTNDTTSLYDIGWVQAGEWTEYTVNVTTTGTYALDLRLANAESDGARRTARSVQQCRVRLVQERCTG